MSPGYLDTKEDVLDSEGYFHTGDMGYYDKDGIIHFVEQVMVNRWSLSKQDFESSLFQYIVAKRCITKI